MFEKSIFKSATKMNKKTALCLVCLALFLAFADAQTISPNLSNSKASGQTILFTDEFENLEKWTNTSDWSADGGLLHHSSTPNVAATSTIAASVANCDFSAGTTIWRFALKTAGFTPTTANYFQFFLMTEKADLTNSQNSGYYVSTTTSNPKVLTLNKLEAGGKKSTLLKTDYVWTQDALICVEVIRAATGLWSISYGNSFNNLTTFASSTTDVTYSSSDSVGLLFTFIKGNVGKLWADSISVVHQPNPISVADFNFNGTDKITVSFSAEVDSASVCNTNNYMLQAGEVISVGYNSSQPKQVVLTVDELQVGSNNLTVSGVADVNGVEMTAAEQFDFEYWIAPQPGDVVVNEIFFDPTPVVALPEYDFFEIYNNRNYAISLNGWKVDVAGTQKELADVVIDANGYVIVTSSAATKEFAKYGTTVVGISTTSLTNTGRAIKLLSDKGAVIDSVSYTQSMIADTEKQAGGWSLERIDANNLCSQRGNWVASEDETGGTPGRENSVRAENKDLLPPFVSSAAFVGNQRIKVQFSEPFVSIDLLNSFDIDGLKNVQLTGEQTVMLDFETSLVEGDYSLKISNISDECGNAMSDTVINLSIVTTRISDVVISEIMADPSPVVGLPEYEYIELYNRTSTSINLEGWTIAVNSTAKTLSQCNIAAGDYLVLCLPAALTEFEKNGPALAVPSLPAIVNAGATITLTDSTGLVIDAVTFDSKWITDKEKADGGWSLERIDANNLCGGANNWAVSVADAGGTPGKQNSVKAKNIDNEPIVISSTHIANDKQIVLFLSELPDEQSVKLVANYQLDGKSPTSVSLNGLQLTLTFAQSFAVDTQLHLSVKDISDQCGNVIDDTTLTLVYHKVALYDLVITEIMATPEPTAGLPACEYVELYNRSNFDIETDSISIKVGKTEAKLEHGVIGAHQYALVAKLSAVDSLAQFGNVIGSQKMPALPATGSISVLCQGNLVCYTNYSSSWYADELKKEGGFSLERISLLSADETGNNWAETIDVRGGTPCHPNSVAIDVADTIAPIALYAVPLSERKVRIVFNKMVIANDASLIEIQPTIGNMLSLVMAPDNYYAIDATLPVAINPNTDYSIIFSKQITDVFGNTIATDTLSLFMPMVAEVGDVVINEVLFNTKAGGCDFVELYNRSDHAVNIATFCLATRSAGAIKTPKHIEQPGYVLPAGGYVVLSTNSQLVMSQYATTDSLAFFNLAALPTYANDHGVVVLADTAGVVYDEFEYDKKMHFALLSSVEGVSLERIDPNKPTDNAANWHSAAEYTGGATPGYQNSCFAPIVSGNSTLSIENEAFSPDNDGFDDQLNICYQFENPGNVASVSIFNAKGVRVRKLVSNEQLGTSGFWSWDGLDDNGNRVPIGVYVVYCELFSTDGESKQIKKPCVVSARMD